MYLIEEIKKALATKDYRAFQSGWFLNVYVKTLIDAVTEGNITQPTNLTRCKTALKDHKDTLDNYYDNSDSSVGDYPHIWLDELRWSAAYYTVYPNCDKLYESTSCTTATNYLAVPLIPGLLSDTFLTMENQNVDQAQRAEKLVSMLPRVAGPTDTPRPEPAPPPPVAPDNYSKDTLSQTHSYRGEAYAYCGSDMYRLSGDRWWLILPTQRDDVLNQDRPVTATEVKATHDHLNDKMDEFIVDTMVKSMRIDTPKSMGDTALNKLVPGGQPMPFSPPVVSTFSLVTIQIIDNSVGLLPEHRLVGQIKDLNSDGCNATTIQQAIMDNPFDEYIAGHNAKRAKILNEDILARTGNEVMLRPIKLKDLELRVVPA